MLMMVSVVEMDSTICSLCVTNIGCKIGLNIYIIKYRSTCIPIENKKNKRQTGLIAEY